MNLENARVLLTGARGYLGSAVATHLDALAQDWEPLATRLEQVPPASPQFTATMKTSLRRRTQLSSTYGPPVNTRSWIVSACRSQERVAMSASFGAAVAPWPPETASKPPPSPRSARNNVSRGGKNQGLKECGPTT